jgi:hypothetical protein
VGVGEAQAGFPGTPRHRDGIKPLPGRVQAIAEHLAPTNNNEV